MRTKVTWRMAVQSGEGSLSVTEDLTLRAAGPREGGGDR